MIHDDELRSVIRAVLDEEKAARTEVAEAALLKAVATILTSFGMDEEDRMEIRRDFIHLRKWRKSVEQAQSITFKVVITTIATGFIGAVWLGVKTMISIKSGG